MYKEEKAKLNYLLTILKCNIEEYIENNAENITPDIEEYYDGIIEEINDILIFSIEGDEYYD